MKLTVKTITELSGLVGEDRHALSAALSEPNAPQKTRRGWIVSEVENFMFLRRLRKMTDADFVALCQQVEHGSLEEGAAAALADYRRGGRLGMIEELERAKPVTEKDLSWLENALEKIQQLPVRRVTNGDYKTTSRTSGRK